MLLMLVVLVLLVMFMVMLLVTCWLLPPVFAACVCISLC